MKQHFKCIYDEVADAIGHARDQGLPLDSVELTEVEWTQFIDDHRFAGIFGFHNKIALKQQGYRQIQFMGHKVFTRGEAVCSAKT